MNISDDNYLRLMILGDVVGDIGRAALKGYLPNLKLKHKPHLTIVNGENAAGGLGLDLSTAAEIRAAGADIITLGDHTWQRKEVLTLLEKHSEWCLRPHNYPSTCPGKGWSVVRRVASDGVTEVSIAVVNMMGRVLMNVLLDCPFQGVDTLLRGPLADVPIRVLDMHAEATSEKVAMGRYLTGRFSAVVGTHTHVQTADEQIFSQHTAYLTDLGMCGSDDGVIGMDPEVALIRFTTSMHAPYKVARGAMIVCGVIVDVDAKSGKALRIERIRECSNS